MRVADSTRTTSSLSGRHSWGQLLDPAVASKLFGAEFDNAFADICARREAMMRLNIKGKYSGAAGFSPSGNAKLAIEIPSCVWPAALAAYGRDVFTNRKKRALFLQEHPYYGFQLGKT